MQTLKRLLEFIVEMFKDIQKDIQHKDYYVHEETPKTYGTRIKR